MTGGWHIPVEIWNHAVRALRRGRARAGRHCLLLELPDGTLVSADPSAAWQHPWFTVPTWDGKQWTATVKPGFVNEWDPTISGLPKSKEDPTDAEMLSLPSIPLQGFRRIPSVGDRLPPFFKALGVLDFFEGASVDASGNVSLKKMPEPTQPPRGLVAMDFFVSVARATYQGHVTITDASGVTGQVADYSVSYNTDQLSRLGTRARLRQAERFIPVRTPTLAERLLNQFQDDGEDRTLISTVYFLSPPDKVNGVPDQTWTPFVQHHQFWNLCHRARNEPPAKPPSPIRLYTGLLGGWGDLIFNQLLTPLNELSQTASNAVATTDNAGKFWSA